jgi:DNA-binding MarR family transcriptional regulator
VAERSDRVARIQQQWARERPDVDVRPQGVIGRLHRLAGHLTEELLVVYRRYGLAEGEFDLLATLRRSGPPFESAPGELAAHTMVTTGAITKRIDRLEQAGLVTRRPNEHDRRVLNVWLTEQGRELRQPIEAMWAALEEISTRHVDEQAIRSFIATARTIESSITNRAAFSQETS